MNASPLNGTELGLHRLATPFAQTRVQRPQQVRRLMAGIDADGQRVPLVVVAQGERFVLINGYQRWAALTRLGRDTAQVEVWEGPLSAALVQVLARHQGRAVEPIEQAWLLSSALAGGLSQRALATALGKDPSWVSRRLALLTALSEPVQEAVRQGVLSTWAASRVFVPLARANAADAAALHREPLSTRELATWYGHYGPANRTARTRMLAQPRLFIQALATRDVPATANDPEAQWLAELERLRQQLQRLARALPALLEPCPAAATWAALRQAVAKTTLERRRQPLQEGAHVVRTTTPDDHRTARQGPEPTSDQSHPGAQPPHGAPGAGAGCTAHPAQQAASHELARTHLDAAHALLRDPRERGADAGVAARAPWPGGPLQYPDPLGAPGAAA
nr:ParB N-terminal domain-containing protein [uncultured Thiodictyon sp.]